MKRCKYFAGWGLMGGIGWLLAGCLFKPAPAPTRYFLLTPIAAQERAPAGAQPLAVEVGFVKMPSYLLRDSMMVRESGNEIRFLNSALWGERLDQCFRQTLAENLSLLLGSERGAGRTSEGSRVVVRVSVTVERFDVDLHGEGRLLAEWRLTLSGSGKALKSGQSRLSRSGPSPRGNPQAIATTLSTMTADFSRELAAAVGEAGQARH